MLRAEFMDLIFGRCCFSSSFACVAGVLYIFLLCDLCAHAFQCTLECFFKHTQKPRFARAISSVQMKTLTHIFPAITPNNRTHICSVGFNPGRQAQAHIPHIRRFMCIISTTDRDANICDCDFVIAGRRAWRCWRIA